MRSARVIDFLAGSSAPRHEVKTTRANAAMMNT